MYSKVNTLRTRIVSTQGIKLASPLIFGSSLSVNRAAQLLNRFRYFSTKVGSTALTPLSLPEFRETSKQNHTWGIVGAATVATLSAAYYFYPQMTAIDQPVTEAQKRIKATYGYVLAGLGATAASAYGLYRVGFHHILLRTNPWTVLGVAVGTSIALLVGIHSTSYVERPILKHTLWAAFNISIGASLCPIVVFGGPLIAQAALATGCIVGGLSLLSAHSPPDSFRQYRAPLGVGLGAVVAASLGNLLFPMPLLHNFVLYGGLVVFSGLIVVDTQTMQANAEKIDTVYDPIQHSIPIYLSTINIFVRMVQILSNLQNPGKQNKQ
jgi:FtsH-binding integral membrane protein